MFLPYSLLILDLKRNDWWKLFLEYRKFLRKRINNSLRIEFLDNGLKSNIVPKFLKFRVPENGYFFDKAVSTVVFFPAGSLFASWVNLIPR